MLFAGFFPLMDKNSQLIFFFLLLFHMPINALISYCGKFTFSQETCTLEDLKSERVHMCVCERLKETLMKRSPPVGKHAERKQAVGCLTPETPALGLAVGGPRVKCE